MTNPLINWQRDPASRRDPYGQVWLSGEQVFRTLNQSGTKNYRAFQASGCLAQLQTERKLIASHEYPTPEQLQNETDLTLEHPKCSFWSYPYEWSFSALRDAALLHLDIQLQVFTHHIVLTDASAYNIQFQQCQPLFIDLCAFRPYLPGEYWQGLKQFCEEFLYPLYFAAYCHLPFQPWYRAHLRGMNAAELWSLMPWHAKRHFHLWKNIFLPARLGHSLSLTSQSLPPLDAQAYQKTLEKLQHCILRLPTPRLQKHWQNYPLTQNYSAEAKNKKLDVLQRFVNNYACQQLLDLGCNTGEYAEAALAAGATFIVGLEQDLASLELAYHRAKQNQLNFLPLYQDLLNPSPTQGFAQIERSGLQSRLQNSDGLLAYACIHHLALPHALDLADIINWFLSLAPRGLIEFVAASDSDAATLATLPRATPYDQTYFQHHLSQHARIIEILPLPGMKRTIFWYERDE